MSKLNDSIEGVIVPLLTPLDEKEKVDEPALRALIRHCLKGGANGIFVGGTAGLGPLLTDREWEHLMEIARDEVDEATLLFAGVIVTSTGRAIDRIRILDRIGFKHMVVTPTFYVTPTREKEFLAHFDGCRQATNMNMIVYNIPSCTGSSIPVRTIAEMVQEGWTTTVKESSGDRDYFLQLTKMVSGDNTVVLQGNEPDIAWGFSVGAKGCVPVCGNYAPSLYAAAWRASQAGDETRLQELQEQMSAIRETLLMGNKSWLAGAMYGVHTLGIGGGNVPRPIQELSPEQKREIEELTESGVIPEVVS